MFNEDDDEIIGLDIDEELEELEGIGEIDW
jgi:hypothetical protein